MKAGTAQKIVLNLFSTAVMVEDGPRLPRTDGRHAGAECEIAPSRSDMVSEIVRCAEADATRHLEQTDGDVKTAVLMGLGLSRAGPRSSSKGTSGNLRAAINEFKVATAERTARSAMAREISEIPESTERLLSRAKLFSRHRRRVKQARPHIVVFCGRGSSGHVGVYLRYLFEARLGIIGSAAAPSVVTAYRRPQDLHNAFGSLSRSPDAVPISSMPRRWPASSARSLWRSSTTRILRRPRCPSWSCRSTQVPNNQSLLRRPWCCP